MAGDVGHRDVARVSLKEFGNGFKNGSVERKDEVGAMEQRLSSKYCEACREGREARCADRHHTHFALLPRAAARRPMKRF